MSNSKRSAKKSSKRITVKPRKLEVYESCGNIFKDMGKSDEEANNLLLRGKLMIEIEKTIMSNKWTQAKAAKVIGVAQPRIAELFSSRIDLFSLDTLIKYLSKLGKEIDITVKNKGAA